MPRIEVSLPTIDLLRIISFILNIIENVINKVTKIRFYRIDKYPFTFCAIIRDKIGESYI